MNGLFIYHRDFRIIDNKTLLELNKKCKNIYTCFIFTPEQVTKKNDFKSENSIQFMIECLKELEDDIKINKGKLLIFFGDNQLILQDLIKELKIDVLACNEDYSPYAQKRLKMIDSLCKKNKIELMYENDYYLYTPGSIKVKSTNKSYVKFTPFYNKVIDIPYDKPDKPDKFIKLKLSNNKIKTNYDLNRATNELITFNKKILVSGSRKVALNILKNIKLHANYEDKRNKLPLDTTQLSAYIKFGCVSVRETAEAFKEIDSLYRQLIWREFYAHILYDYPYTLYGPLKEKYSNVKWSNSKIHLDSWKDCKTGYPIVDAAMTQLNTTGYMHNRGRLIVACFLIKTLLINWQEGEKYFATKLTDYDPASNNGNWQWVASTGADSQPYFRIFNPWKQSKDYDPDCIYIKKWLPELTDVDNKHIHKWDENYDSYKNIKYYKPIVDYKTQREKALEMYKQVI